MPFGKVPVAQLREDLARFEAMIVQCELNAALPPADCRHPDLFSAQELQFADQYRRTASQLREEISLREGQLTLAI